MGMTVLDYARSYLNHGWQPIPIPYKEKGPIKKRWNQLKLTTDELPKHFNGKPQNIGILLGDMSNGLVDIDLDCAKAIELAPKYLPNTLCFGRKSKPKSHWLFISPGLANKAFKAVINGDEEVLCETRSSTLQTVFPPSTHPSGEDIRFVESNPQPLPTSIDAEKLFQAVQALAFETAQSLGAEPGWLETNNKCEMEKKEKAVKNVEGDDCKYIEPVVADLNLENKRYDNVFDMAAERYNKDHYREFSDKLGSCPFCGHNDCFRYLINHPDHWCCFSTAHSKYGIEGPTCWYGDILDLDAFNAGLKRHELLRRDGYLDSVKPSAKTTMDAFKAMGPNNNSDQKNAEPNIILETDCRPVIVYENGEGGIAVRAAINALSMHNNIYKRAQKLVTVIKYSKTKKNNETQTIKREEDSPIICPVSSGYLWEVFSDLVRWERYDHRSKRRAKINPPHEIINSVHTRSEWEVLSALRGLVTNPILRRDGTLCCDPGLDDLTGLYYSPSCELPKIPDKPTKLYAEMACASLKEVVRDFPFSQPEHKSVWLSVVLSRVGWGAFNDGVPLTVIDATTPGTGKTLLADTAAIISTGCVAARSPYVESNDEIRKRITSHLMAGDQIALIDNVPGGAVIGWPALDAALTGEEWQDRELGKNVATRYPIDTMFMVTGNNIGVGKDTGRRALYIRLETEEEHPEQRSDFLHPDLLSWVKKERPRLLAAALTMLRGYICAGRPKIALSKFGSFNGWSDLVRSAIVWCGEPDPALAVVSADESSDPEHMAHVRIMLEWKLLDELNNGIELTASQILKKINTNKDKYNGIIEALEVLCPSNTGYLPNTQEFGYCLKRLKGRVKTVNGVKMKIIGRSSCNTTKWSIRIIDAKTYGTYGASGAFICRNSVSGREIFANSDSSQPGTVETPITPITPIIPHDTISLQEPNIAAITTNKEENEDNSSTYTTNEPDSECVFVGDMDTDNDDIPF